MKVDMSGVAAKLSKIATNRRLGQFLADTAANGMDKYVPFRTGHLVGSSETSPFKVTYTANYAKYPFYGKDMTIHTEHHPNATSRWDRAYAIAQGQELADAGTKFIRTKL